MPRILRAFAWMRWRIFLNSLEKTGTRDSLERFSLAIEHIAPIALVLVMIPSALALSGLAGYAGYELASGVDRPVAVRIVRYMLLVATVLALVGPMLLPAGDRTNPVRLLLLPIPRRTLYVAQAAGTFADPWIMLLVPMVAALPIGMALGGAYLATAGAIAAGALVVLTVVAVSALTTTLIHLVLRDRRRGELIALAFVLILPLVSFIPAMIRPGEGPPGGRARAVQQERTGPREPAAAAAGTAGRAASRAFAAAPSELYMTTVTRASDGRTAAAAGAAVALAATAAALHGIGFLLFGRALTAPLTGGARHVHAHAGLWPRVLPGLTPGASAVALAHIRLAFRTPRGRAILVSPLLMLVLFGFLTLRAGSTEFLPFRMNGGLGLATFASAIALLSILPIAMNQFAVDGAGFTLSLLSPLSTRQLLAGKAVGNGVVAVSMSLLCVGLAAAVFRGGSLSAWLSLVLSLVATYTLTAPAAAAFSAVLPRAVDMNSIGRGSNAHGLAGFLGLAVFGLSALPCIGLVLVATQLLRRPALAPVLLVIWWGVSLVAARVLFVVAGHVFDRRRENISMLM